MSDVGTRETCKTVLYTIFISRNDSFGFQNRSWRYMTKIRLIITKD